MGYSRSRARCLPLQYPSSATRGVKQALNINKKPLSENLIVVSSPLQEKENITYKALNILNQESINQVSQSESGMFYELSNKKIMECEKYQDCSWFQSSPMKLNCNKKFSPAETFDSFIGTDEFDLPMQYANSQISPWGDEYLEVLTDDISPEENYKLGEKNKNDLLDENFYDKYKENEENGFDSYNLNFTLKKTDSTDSMKNISSTNPAEIIPISFKERMNNSNYGLAKLAEVKSEIKEEVESYSPESNSFLMDSDDSGLIIGREETVEEMDSTEGLQVISEKQTIILDGVKSEIPALKILSDYTVNEKNSKIENNIYEDINFKATPYTVKAQHGIVSNNTNREKLDLNFDITKLTFEQTLNVNTPDLDFMDLVDFINEEMRQENNLTVLNSTPNKSITQLANANQDLVSENQSNSKNNQPSDVLSSQPSSSQNQSSVNNLLSKDSKSNNSTLDLEVVSTGFSIAERIKTTAKRKTRKDIKDLIESEDESSESMDDDEDYDYNEDIANRRCTPVRRRTKSSASDSKGDGKRMKEEYNSSSNSSSYRERRDKNNEASRRSRQNRKAREQHMYETLEEEEKRNVKLKAEADVLEKQVTSLRQLLLQVVLHKGGAT